MNNHVTSLELSKKLKAVRIEQKSEFYWRPQTEYGRTEYHLYRNGEFFEEGHNTFGRNPGDYSAFLASELLEMLPREIPKNLDEFLLGINSYFEDSWEWGVEYLSHGDYETLHFVHHKSLSEAAGETALWAKENGYL